MRSSRTLALALIGSTHVSLCAGSMLSVLLVLLAHVADPALALTPMTPALEGSVCLLQTPFDGVTPEAEKSACSDGEQCFEEIAFAVHKADVLTITNPSPMPIINALFASLPSMSSREWLTSFAYRPPGHARLFAMSPVRRE